MKRLILLRHAKAVTKDAARDFDRALSTRGQAQARAMATVLSALDPGPEIALVSPAARTRETWDLASADLADIPATFDQAIYEATTAQLLKLVRAMDAGAATAIMVGHNPSFEDVAIALAAPDGTPGWRDLQGGMPTGSAAILDFEVVAWSEVAEGGGRLASFLTPDGIGSAQA